MWSKYLRTLEKDGVVAIFHELHPKPIFLGKSEWIALQQGNVFPEDVLKQFREKGLLITSPEEDKQAFLNAEQKMLSALDQTKILYLMTAQGCQVKCTYCMVPEIARRFGATLLSKEAARAGIDLWCEHLKDESDKPGDRFVIFYGGEPLLNKPVVFDALRYLDFLKEQQKLPRSVQYLVATNGIEVDQEFVDVCVKHSVSVAVGLDGDQEANDLLKRDVEGFGTFARILDAINLLTKANVPTFVSCSLTPHNIDSAEETGAFFKNIGVSKFGFNILRGQKLVDLVGEDGVEEYYRSASRAIIQHARTQSDQGFEFQMEKKALAYEKGEFFPLDCTCYGSQLVIQPDGQVSNCPFYKARLGDVTSLPPSFRIREQEIVQKWRGRLPLYHEGMAKSLSGGGCAWGATDQRQDPASADLGSRIFAEEALNEFIWKT